MQYWPEESKPVVGNNILESLKIPANCGSVPVSILNEAVAKYRNIMPFHKKADKILSDIQKRIVFTASVVLEIADELILQKNENRPRNLRKFIAHTIDSVSLMGRAQKQLSAEREQRLKRLLNEDIEKICDKETSDSKYLFGESLVESMNEAKK